ncbi:subtype I-B CRISPR-associated endonuclease Cas1 [Thermoplasma sp. Kam2015]|uniref:type I-B CRISPR-associated endonuclease Cas1b n=1 Tax=Thermoplasma sp. Kam2015 TaxID=2094122 RepID=UPI000D8FE4AA|nr:type I-B CRISPR-associated endonuclease Cas1b [Thermoplasma sp. Kam2015]PYB67551.1 subtype I-B CRISPR-associated endonuclease Cas1 [Thermoplasma sp. Kam2015]
MRPYYLNSNGILSRKDESLTLKSKDGESEIPLNDVDSIIVLGNITITKPAIQLLSKTSIPVFIMSMSGRYISSILPENYLISGKVRIMQFSKFIDENSRMFLARAFVIGAARNYNITLKRHRANKIKINYQDIISARNIQSLMGVEGNIADSYFDALDTILPDYFKIGIRTRRPPLSFGNALISFINSLIYSTVASEIFCTHLDPTVSFLHEPSSARNSLALDVSEIFKPIFGHSVIISMIKRKEIKPEMHFISDEGVFLNESGRRLVLNRFSEELEKTVYSKALSRYISNKHLIRLELYKLERFIMEGEYYKPYTPRR